MKRVTLAFFLLTPCLANSKAVFSPNLQAQLDSVPAQAVVEAFLVVKNRAPIGLLKAAMPNATRQRLHTEVVTALKEKSASTQADLLRILKEEKSAGPVLDFKSYWIDNYVFVRATKEALLRLSERAEIAEVFENPKLVLIEPVESSAASPAAATETVSGKAEPNLIGIGARQVWRIGLTGKGRLICHLDTGVDGNHRAFRTRWRGRRPGISPAAAWFDPVRNIPTPHTYPTNPNHGTHVMGIMCGLDTNRTINGGDTAIFVDTIGVAPEAEWISAAVIDNGANGAAILDALQWAADPDGNPNTVEDVPDAVNNSWGYATTGAGNNLGCHPFFYQAIDHVEASGAVVVFAAGNNGPSLRSIANPADRGTSPLANFAVGNFDLDSVRTDPANPDSVTALFGKMNNTSSIGPSRCGPDSLKPQISAPGTAIYSAFASGQFGLLTGTSMAAPHISGAVAILRQYNPNATVDAIKWALLQSATDLGSPGPDTLSGWGLLNLPKALELMPPNEGIHLYVKKDRIADVFGQPPYAGGTFSVYLNLSNSGVDTARSVYGKLSVTDGKSLVLSDSSFFGDLTPLDTASNFGNPFAIRLVQNLFQGERFMYVLELRGENGFQQTLDLSFPVGEALFKTLYHHQNGNVEFTVTNFGAFGLEPGGLETRALPVFKSGLGFQRKTEPGGTRTFEASFMVGMNDSMVSNTASNEFCCFPQVLQAPDADFAVHEGGNLVSAEPGLSGGHETFSVFDDRLAAHPAGLAIAQRSWTFEEPGKDNFAILEFCLRNLGTQALNDLRAGIFYDFNFHSLSSGQFIGEKADFDRAADLGYAYNQAVPAYRGIASADTGKLSTFKAVRIFPGVSDGFTQAEKWQFLTSGFSDTAVTTLIDGAILAGKGPFALAPGDSVKIAFALAAALDLDSLKIYAQAARNIYQSLISPKGDLNGDGTFTAVDLILHMNCVFLSSGNCPPLSQLDLNCDGQATVADVTILMNRVFLGIPLPCP